MEIQISAAIMENYMKVSQKIKNRTSIWFSNTIARLMSKAIETSKLKRPLRGTTRVLKIAKMWTQSKCLSNNICMKNVWCLYTIEYSLGIRRINLSFATTWMNLRIIY